jgi:hypothetical protein
MAAPFTRPRRPFWVVWFWEMPDFEMEHQVAEYDTLSLSQSYRKQSAVLLAFVAVLSLVLIFAGQTSLPAGIFSFLLQLTLASFAVRGNRVALGVAMALLTANSAVALTRGIINPLTWLILVPLWAFFMERYWRAYDVERVRAWTRKHPGEATAAAAPVPAAGEGPGSYTTP